MASPVEDEDTGLALDDGKRRRLFLPAATAGHEGPSAPSGPYPCRYRIQQQRS
jgi:hypothetical protein